MKKCTAYQFIVSLCITVTCAVSSMETKLISNGKGICYFSIMVPDILNAIAHWLMWESQEEFIARIKIVKMVPEKYRNLFTFEAKRCVVGSDDGHSPKISSAYCPDETKIALFELVCGKCPEPKLMVIDIQKEKEENMTIYDGKLDTGSYRSIGLSCSGNMFAVIQKQSMVGKDWIEIVSKDVLVIQKLATREEKKFTTVCKFDIPACFVPISIDFNKQGTQVVVGGNDSKEVKHSKIFSLKKSEYSLEYTTADNLLLDFF